MTTLYDVIEKAGRLRPYTMPAARRRAEPPAPEDAPKTGALTEEEKAQVARYAVALYVADSKNSATPPWNTKLTMLPASDFRKMPGLGSIDRAKISRERTAELRIREQGLSRAIVLAKHVVAELEQHVSADTAMSKDRREFLYQKTLYPLRLQIVYLQTSRVAAQLAVMKLRTDIDNEDPVALAQANNSEKNQLSTAENNLAASYADVLYAADSKDSVAPPWDPELSKLPRALLIEDIKLAPIEGNRIFRKYAPELRVRVHELSRAIALAQRVDSELNQRMSADAGISEARRDFLNHNFIFPLRRQIIELQTSLAVAQQSVLGMEISIDNNSTAINNGLTEWPLTTIERFKRFIGWPD